MKTLISFFAVAAIVGFIGCDSGVPKETIGPILPDPINIDPPEKGQDNDSSTPTGSVDGTTLVVNGNEYPRDPDETINGDIVTNGNREYVAGQLMVHFFNTNKAQVKATLDALGLEVIRTHTGHPNFFLVSVPELFEEQWKAALDDLEITAWVNGINSLD